MHPLLWKKGKNTQWLEVLQAKIVGKIAVLIGSMSEPTKKRLLITDAFH
jgi:hypothetical protein